MTWKQHKPVHKSLESYASTGSSKLTPAPCAGLRLVPTRKQQHVEHQVRARA